MAGVFRNIDPPPPHRPASVYPPAFRAGVGHTPGWKGGGGSIVRKTPDTALYSIYVSTLWFTLSLFKHASLILLLVNTLPEWYIFRQPFLVSSYTLQYCVYLTIAQMVNYEIPWIRTQKL